MRKMLWAGLLVLAACKNEGGAGAAASSGALTTDDQKTLYTLGVVQGRQLEIFNLTPEELAVVQRGLKDQVSKANLEVKPEEFLPKLSALARSRRDQQAQQNLQKGQEYLTKAAAEPNAKKLEGGIVFVPQQEGTGASPAATDRVKVHYKGTLTDGKEFDSSYQRNEPATFPLNGVIRCWTLGLQQMKVGGKARLVCPADVAYGPMGRPGAIPPNATLDFQVELLEILPQEAAPAAPPAPGTPPPAAPKAPPAKK
jgi:FKBP-type peptidyl-prolyl cis-trans isomerase FkpA